MKAGEACCQLCLSWRSGSLRPLQLISTCRHGPSGGLKRNSERRNKRKFAKRKDTRRESESQERSIFQKAKVS